MDYIRQVVPEATKLSIKSSAKTEKGKLQSEAIDYLLENTPDFLCTANHSGLIDSNITKPYYQEIYNKGCFLVCSAGNVQDELNKLTKGNLWKAIGACEYNNGAPKVVERYADGEEMDFVSFHKLYCYYDKQRHKGTSYSQEVFMGMCALVQCFFKIKTGKKLSHEQLMKFLKDNCIDLEEEGHDVKTGYGLFILPEPTSINISKYCEYYQESGEEDMPRYNTLEEVPEWGKATVEKLIQKGALKGDGNELNMDEVLLRTLVIHDRLGIYD